MLELDVFDEAKLKTFLDAYESQLETIATTYNAASFDQYTGLSVPTTHKLNFSQNSAVEPEVQQLIKNWLPKVRDPMLKRRLLLLNKLFLEAALVQPPAIYQLRNSINAQLLRFQPHLGKRKIQRSQVNEILRTNDDRAFRQYVFETATKPLAYQLAPQVQELMRLRNSAAQSIGASDFATLQLSLADLQVDELLELFEQLDTFTDVPYRHCLQVACVRNNLSQPQAWDLNWLAAHENVSFANLFPADQSLSHLKVFLTYFGLDFTRLPIKIVTADVPFNGLCYTVRIPDDIRILMHPKDGYPYFRTLLHEFGHALHAASCQQKFYSLKYEAGVFNEGMAEVLAYFSDDLAWQMTFAGFDQQPLAIYQQGELFRHLLRLRTWLAQARFEIEAYRNPNQDLQFLHASLESQYLHVPFNSTPRWAASSFPTTHPVYRQNYILAEMIAAQTHAALQIRFGNFWEADLPTRQAVFRFLVGNYYAPGASVDWKTKIEQTTNQKLNVHALFAQFDFS